MANSTINPSNPATASPLASSVVRANFLAAYNDINALYGQFTALGGDLWATSGPPASTVGKDGDYAIDAAAGEIYGPKTGGAWPTTPVSLGGAGAYTPATGGSVAFANATALPANTYNNSAGTITATANAALTSTVCDGVTPTVGMRCWIWDFTQAAGGNVAYGLYTVTQVGSASLPFILTRAADASTAALLGKLLAFVIGVAGSVHAGKTLAIPLAAAQITLGTTLLNPTVIGGPGGVQAETQRALTAEAAIPGTVRAQELVASLTQAAGTAGAVKLLVTGDGAKTYRSGTTVGEIQTLASLIGPSCVQPAFAWNPGSSGIATGGAPLMPTQNTDGSLLFHTESGFVVPAAIPSQFSIFTIDMIVSFPAVTTTFASRAAGTSDTTLFTNQIGAVSGEGFIVPQAPSADLPLLKYRANGNYPTASLIDGLYAKLVNGGAFVSGMPLLMIGLAANLASRYISITMDQRGQIVVGGYDGVDQPGLQSYCYNAYATGGKIHIRLTGDGTYFGLWVNGMHLFNWKGVFTLAPDHVYINGNGGEGNNIVPVFGWPYSLYALCITEGLLFPAARAVHDNLANAYGTRPMDWSPKMFGRILMGQSQENGSTDASSDTGDVPDSDNNWNGMTTALNQQYPSYSCLFTQTPMPRNYFISYPTNALNIGPIDLQLNIYGIGAGAHSISGSGGETLEWGFDYWIRKIPEFANADFIGFGVCFGAYSFPALTFRSSPPIFPPTLRDFDTSVIYGGNVPGHVSQDGSPTELLERQVLAAMDFAHSRGQIFEVAIFEYSQGETVQGETNNYGSELISYFQSEIANIQALTGQTRVPICFSKEINVKTSTLNNQLMVAPWYYQDQRRRMTPEANPTVIGGLGNNVVTAGPGSITLIMFNGNCDYADGGAWIHKPNITYRKRGERHGHLIYQVMTGNTPRSLVVLSQSVATAATANINVGDLVLQLNQAAQFVVTQQPNITRTLLTPAAGGTPTYGLVLVPAPSSPSATIASVFFKTGDATTLVVRLSRAGIATSGPTVGDALTATGTNAFFTNIKAQATITGNYADQDWVYGLANLQTISSRPGYVPFRESTTLLNDLTPFLASGLYQF